MSHEEAGHKMEAHSIELHKPISAMCLDTQDKYVVALEGGHVYRVRKAGENLQFKLIFKSRDG